MSLKDSILQSLRPTPKRLYESSVCLASCLKNHEEAKGPGTKTDHDGVSSGSASEPTEKPTLAAMARHYKLGQLLRSLAPLIVVQERLYRRLEERPDVNAAARKTFPELFQVMDIESRTILKISSDFSVEKEDRYAMEANLNLLRESVVRITEALQTVREAQYESPGRLNNKLADTVDALRVDWHAVQSIRASLPERYPLDYEQLHEKSS
ncbi:uncharacterized protein LOC110980825 [Acanthaster planci]|uniref:Uncharacterized protein LOC110980825 n=1 Tax=Acanthaster planci TaxID=133434 RepID=A0A8B7YLK6_ACAPL|nr:uncharacterized protein LOC110980825 [Acanthaster planci]XP_022093522.1 uncharacterized protein LOC110980825 [Acanthaster planci]